MVRVSDHWMPTVTSGTSIQMCVRQHWPVVGVGAVCCQSARADAARADFCPRCCRAASMAARPVGLHGTWQHSSWSLALSHRCRRFAADATHTAQCVHAPGERAYHTRDTSPHQLRAIELSPCFPHTGITLHPSTHPNVRMQTPPVPWRCTCCVCRSHAAAFCCCC